MTAAERERFFDDLGRVFMRAAVRDYLREIEERMRREREKQPRDEREQKHRGGAGAQ